MYIVYTKRVVKNKYGLSITVFYYLPSVILIDSAFKIGKNYYIQVLNIFLKKKI